MGALQALRKGNYTRFIVENVIEFKQVSQRINWHTIFFVGVFHLFAVWALFTFSWQNLAAALVLWWIAASWGVGSGITGC